MKPLQLPHPPIAVAASTSLSGSLKVAGAQGWSPMSSSILSKTFLPGHWNTYAEAANAAGNSANRSDWRIARDVFVGPTPRIARERARAVLGRNYDVHQLPSRKNTAQMELMKIDPDMKDEDIDVDYLMEHVWIVGDPKECADKVRALYDDVGGFGTLLSITADPTTPAGITKVLRSSPKKSAHVSPILDRVMVSQTVAAFVAAADAKGLPPEVVHAAKRSLLNFFATALEGTHDVAVEKTLETLRPFAGAGRATLIGRAERDGCDERRLHQRRRRKCARFRRHASHAPSSIRQHLWHHPYLLWRSSASLPAPSSSMPWHSGSSLLPHR